MGGRGSTSGKGSKSSFSGVKAGETAKSVPSSESYAFSYSARSITRDKLFEAIKTINPTDFATYQQPDIIRVSGVDFNRLSSSEFINPSNNNKIFSSNYQATKAAADGTYPTFRIVVERNTRKIKGGTKVTYKYDKSTAGTTVD